MTQNPLLPMALPIRAEKPMKNTDLRRILRGLFSLLSALSLLLCSFYAAKTVDDEKRDAWLRVLLYGGLVRTVECAGADVPVIAEPINEEITDDKDVASLFATLYDAPGVGIPTGCYAIVPCDLSSERGDELKLYNDTLYEPDVNKLKSAAVQEAAVSPSDAPLVLVIHTHGTEAYSDAALPYYSESENVPRSSDTKKNVVAVGAVLCERLNANGIATVHCEVMHDAESYLGSYQKSADSIRELLRRYPSIRYVFDVHRDSVLYEDGRKARPVTLCNGKVTAQVLTVVGTDQLGDDHPNWEYNLSFAAKLQNKLNADFLGFARAICLRSTSYNQELVAHSLLLEIGSCGNSLEEAKNAAEILGDTIAEMIREGW